MENSKSRTQKKKEAKALQAIGEALVALSPEQLDRMDLEETLLEAVRSARNMTKHGARRRQMQYIGTLMREIDPEPIQTALENITLGDHQEILVFKRIEKWRDDLMAGNPETLAEILDACPDADRRHLTQLARNAQKTAGTGKGVKPSRVLFRYLKEISGG